MNPEIFENLKMNKNNFRRDALAYHSESRPGKIEVRPTKKSSTRRDLSLAYSPGVAAPCREIVKDKSNSYKYTAKGNLVAVISNGTAVLGLGDIGPEASKPVMEGKGLLFKIFADIDVFDIEVDTRDVEAFIDTVKKIANTFGGINLEDIKAPEAFEIEKRLKQELEIPVMHDDQHGTAIISAAALLNALELARKKIEKVRIVISGAGAAAVSCTRLYMAFGARKENIVMIDSKGVIREDRSDLSQEKREFATKRKIDTLKEAIKDADVFIGLSVANILTVDMLRSMAKRPVVFAMANPDPEIEYELAIATRKDIIMATGRSDHPNQVNNVLGFPFIFRGALDVRATKINEAMKMAAVKALAALAKEPVPEQVNIAYGETKLAFGPDYIIPKPFDSRLITHVPPAVAKAAMESGVATFPIEDWEGYKAKLSSRMGTNNPISRLLMDRAKTDPKRIIFAEADHLDVLKAAQIVQEEGIGIPVLLGKEDVVLELMKEIEFDPQKITLIDPGSEEALVKRNEYANRYWEMRARSGVTRFDAQNLMKEVNYFGAMMVNQGDADALVSGYSRAYPTVVKPMLKAIGPAKEGKKVAAVNLINSSLGPLFISDSSITIDPSAEDLAEIALMTAKTVRLFGMEPVIAMISYANFGSSKHVQARKVREAVSIIQKAAPDLKVDGELQIDFALNQNMRREKFPFSKLVNEKVNTLIFPNLEAANSAYKLLKELGTSDSIGPIMMGMNKPVHVFQLGAGVDEMVNMAAVAVIDAQEKQKRKTRS